MEAQIRERFQQMVWRELGLTEEQGEAMNGVVEEFQVPRRELSQRQRVLQRRMSGTGALLSESEARSVLEELVSVREAEVVLLRREQERLLEILTPPQLVRFYMLRDQFAARIRQLRENRPGGGGPPMGLLPGGGGTGGFWPVLEN
jgi:Spy/CpxP family protein refolding chaperone